MKPSIASRTAGQANLQVTEHEVVEDGDALVIRGQNSAVHTGAFLGIGPTGGRVSWERLDMYRAGADGRLNRHFLAAGWNLVRLQLLGQAPDLPATLPAGPSKPNLPSSGPTATLAPAYSPAAARLRAAGGGFHWHLVVRQDARQDEGLAQCRAGPAQRHRDGLLGGTEGASDLTDGEAKRIPGCPTGQSRPLSRPPRDAQQRYDDVISTLPPSAPAHARLREALCADLHGFSFLLGASDGEELFGEPTP
jgi:SnoaL-like polyketide cyclase